MATRRSCAALDAWLQHVHELLQALDPGALGGENEEEQPIERDDAA